MRELAIQERLRGFEKSKSQEKLRASKSSKIIRKPMRDKSNRRITPLKMKKSSTNVNLREQRSKSPIELRKKTPPKVPKLNFESALFPNNEKIKISRVELRRSVSKNKKKEEKKKLSKSAIKKRKKKKKVKKIQQRETLLIPSCALSNKMTKAALQRREENQRKLQEIERQKREKEKYSKWDIYTKFKHNDEIILREKEEENRDFEYNLIMKRKMSPTRVQAHENKRYESKGESSFNKKMKVLKEYTPEIIKKPKTKKKIKKKAPRDKTPNLGNKTPNLRDKTPNVRDKTPVLKKKKKRVKKKKEEEYYEVSRGELKAFSSKLKNSEFDTKEKIVPNLLEVRFKHEYLEIKRKLSEKLESSDRRNLASLEGRFPQEKFELLKRHESSPKVYQKNNEENDDFKVDKERRNTNSTSTATKIKEISKLEKKRRKRKEENINNKNNSIGRKKKDIDVIIYGETGDGFNSKNESDLKRRGEKSRIRSSNKIKKSQSRNNLNNRKSELNGKNLERSASKRRQKFEFSNVKKKDKKTELSKNKRKEKPPSDNKFLEIHDKKSNPLNEINLLLDGLTTIIPSRFSNRIVFSNLEPVFPEFSPLPPIKFLPRDKENKQENVLFEMNFSEINNNPKPPLKINKDLLSVPSIEGKQNRSLLSNDSNKIKESIISKEKNSHSVYFEEDISYDPNEEFSSQINNKSSTQVQSYKNSIMRSNTEILLEEASEMDFDPNGSSIDINKSRTKRSRGEFSVTVSAEPYDEDIVISSYKESKVSNYGSSGEEEDTEINTIVLEDEDPVRNLDNLPLLEKSISREMSKNSQGREFFTPRREFSDEEEENDNDSSSGMGSDLMYDSFSQENQK